MGLCEHTVAATTDLACFVPNGCKVVVHHESSKNMLHKTYFTRCKKGLLQRTYTLQETRERRGPVMWWLERARKQTRPAPSPSWATIKAQPREGGRRRATDWDNRRAPHINPGPRFEQVAPNDSDGGETNRESAEWRAPEDVRLRSLLPQLPGKNTFTWIDALPQTAGICS